MVCQWGEHRSARVTARWDWAMSVLFCVVALGLNLYHLGTPSIWFDEAFSVELARQPLPVLWHIISGPEPNMELYYLLLHGWLAVTALFGMHPTEFVVRLPSAICAALSALIVFWFGRRYVGRLVGVVATSLYVLNYLQLVYAQQARSYSLQLVLVCLAWYAFLAATLGQERQRRWWVCFVVATTLAIYAHLFSVFLLLAQVCTFGVWWWWPNPWCRRARQQWLAGLVSLLCVGLANIPILLVSLQLPKTDWLPVPQFRDILLVLLAIGGNNKIYVLTMAVLSGLGVLVAVEASIPQGTALRESMAGGVPEKQGHLAHVQTLRCYLPVSLALVCWLCVPIALSFVISQGAIHIFSSRYLVTVVPALLLLVSMSIAVLRRPAIQLVLTCGLLLLAFQVVPFYYRSAQVEDWNATSLWLEQQYQAGDGLVCYDNAPEQGCQISVEYYLQAYPSSAHFTADTPGAFSWATFRATQPEAAVDPRVLASFGRHYSRIFFIVGRLPDHRAAMLAEQAQSWLDSHDHLVAQIVKRTVTVRLYTTRPTVMVGTCGGILWLR